MAKIFHSLQYLKATGEMLGRISGATRIDDKNFPPEAAQVVIESDDSIPAPDITGMRINLQTLTMEPCPKLAVMTQINEKLYQLSQCDTRRDRALAEAFVSGDKTWLTKHLGDADALRAQITDLNTQLAAVPAQVPKSQLN